MSVAIVTKDIQGESFKTVVADKKVSSSDQKVESFVTRSLSSDSFKTESLTGSSRSTSPTLYGKSVNLFDADSLSSDDENVQESCDEEGVWSIQQKDGSWVEEKNDNPWQGTIMDPASFDGNAVEYPGENGNWVQGTSKDPALYPKG